MKSVCAFYSRSLIWFICGIACWTVCADVPDESAIISFWHAHPDLDEKSRMEYEGELKKHGIVEASALAPYLNSEQFCPQALYSMALLMGKSKPLEPAVYGKVVDLATNATVAASVGEQALRLILTTYPADPRSKALVENELARYFWYGGQDESGKLIAPVATRSAAMSTKWLFLLGEFSENHKEQASVYLRQAESILSIKVAGSGFAMTVPRDDPYSFHTFLAAANWPLYDRPELSVSIARVAINYLSRSRIVASRVRSEDIKPAIELLLTKSKADPDYLAEQINKICLEDSKMACVILWILKESGDSATTKKLEQLIASNQINKDLLRKMRSGAMSKEKAFDKPLAEIYAKGQ